jgi:tRNA threonylcarbamoyladenosine biosynthesis protein TsaE
MIYKKSTIIIENEKEAECFGLNLSQGLKPKTVIALTGDLGVGKTTLTKAIARGLGIKEVITSPTFILMRQYSGGRLPLYHFDMYRIEDEEEIHELGFIDYFYMDGVCVIEWADKIWGSLPKHMLHIHMEYADVNDQRIYTVNSQ